MLRQRPTLLLLDGPSGAGKSAVLNYLRRTRGDDVAVGRKYTTRARREGDNDWEFTFVERIPSHASAYAFSSVTSQYALDPMEVSAAPTTGKIYCVTCTDLQTLQKLRQDFAAVLVYIFRPLTDAALNEIFDARGGADHAERDARRNEVRDTGPDYLAKIGLIDHVILNVRSENLLFAQVDALLSLYSPLPAIEIEQPS